MQMFNLTPANDGEDIRCLLQHIRNGHYKPGSVLALEDFDDEEQTCAY